ncbi:hypothetical protein ACNTMW_06900 [Planosporangium sp. 12N6]|uniref:hypothetical protein n=1 Tax=Planosporangium spinosum TaxID=3402278 RepID=UPI003CF5AFF7
MIRPHPRSGDETVAARAARLERLVGRLDPANLPGWLRPTGGERRWPAAVAMLGAIGLQVALPENLASTPRWLLPLLEFLLLGLLVFMNPFRIDRETTLLRIVSITLVAVASVANAWSAVLLIRRLVHGAFSDAGPLLFNGGAVWMTNVIVFALWYWEVDRGGPAARANARADYPDFLFPQMATPELAHRDWEPHFLDYLYLSFTNATAFSPTDTMPLSRSAKLTMMVQSAVSLLIVALVVARAVNILR